MEDSGVKLQGGDSRLGETHRPLPVEERGDLRGCQTNRRERESREERLPSTNKQHLKIRISGKREREFTFSPHKTLLYQYSL